MAEAPSEPKPLPEGVVAENLAKLFVAYEGTHAHGQPVGRWHEDGGPNILVTEEVEGGRGIGISDLGDVHMFKPGEGEPGKEPLTHVLSHRDVVHHLTGYYTEASGLERLPLSARLALKRRLEKVRRWKPTPLPRRRHR